MSPTSQSEGNDVIALNQRISSLELELDAYAAHASGLQARLVSTLDALQRARVEHADELAAARKREDTLQAKFAAARKVAADSETAQKELREGVLLLVEKVEICNDYSLWPHSGLHATSLAAPPITPMYNPSLAEGHTGSDSFHAYATSVIGNLQTQAERDKRTRSDLQSRVNLLEALLAQRDLELELAASPAICAHCAPSLNATRLRSTREDAIRLLETSAARNRVLADEIAVLVQRLEQARATRSPEPSPEGSPTLSHERDLSLGVVPAFSEETTIVRKPPRPPTPHPPRIYSASCEPDEDPPSPTRVVPYKMFTTKGDHTAIDNQEKSHNASALQLECERLRMALAASQQEVSHLRSMPQPSFVSAAPAFTAPSNSPHMPPPLNAPQPVRPPSGPIELFADSDNDSEQSMELASPLQPTLTMLRSSNIEQDPVGERSGPASSGSRPSRPLSPLLPYLNPALASLQPLSPVPLSAVSAGPLPPVFTLRPAPSSDPAALRAAQASGDALELERVLEALEHAQKRLEAQDQELTALRGQM